MLEPVQQCKLENIFADNLVLLQKYVYLNRGAMYNN